MSGTRSRFRRPFAGVLVLLQLAAVTASPAHAAPTDPSVPHLEAAGTDTCAPPHDADACRLCRITPASAAMTPDACPRLLAGRESTPPPVLPGPVRPAHPDANPPRAPPLPLR